MFRRITPPPQKVKDKLGALFHFKKSTVNINNIVI